MLAWRASERQLRGAPVAEDPAADVVPPGVGTVLNVLRSSALVVDEGDRVVQASAPAYTLGLVREGELRNDELAELVRKVRRDGEIRQVDLDIHRPGPAAGPRQRPRRRAEQPARAGAHRGPHPRATGRRDPP